MEKLEVIDRVVELRELVNSMLVATKKNGALRVCLDPQDLNRAVKCQHYKLPTREEIMAEFCWSKEF